MEKETPSCLSAVRSSGVVHARGIAGEGQRNGAAISQQYPGRMSVECSLNQADFGSRTSECPATPRMLSRGAGSSARSAPTLRSMLSRI